MRLQLRGQVRPKSGALGLGTSSKNPLYHFRTKSHIVSCNRLRSSALESTSTFDSNTNDRNASEILKPSTTNRYESELDAVNSIYRKICISALAATAILPAAALAANASTETAPNGLLEAVVHIVESLGPFAPVAFILAVAFFECLPLFPTQPLSLASGVLFGAQKGALLMLIGTTAAAVIAFLISRGIGRPLAERIIKAEMAHSNNDSAEDGNTTTSTSSTSNPAAGLQRVTEAIERGSFVQQAAAVLVLRLTPVIPFSASNYILGLSPLPLPPFLAGTLGGMAFWSTIYASVGSASRSLFRPGTNPDVLLANMMEKAGDLSESTTAGVAVVAVLAGGYLYKRQSDNSSNNSEGSSEKKDGAYNSIDENGIARPINGDKGGSNNNSSNSLFPQLPLFNGDGQQQRELVEQGKE